MLCRHCVKASELQLNRAVKTSEHEEGKDYSIVRLQNSILSKENPFKSLVCDDFLIHKHFNTFSNCSWAFAVDFEKLQKSNVTFWRFFHILLFIYLHRVNFTFTVVMKAGMTTGKRWRPKPVSCISH